MTGLAAVQANLHGESSLPLHVSQPRSAPAAWVPWAPLAKVWNLKQEPPQVSP